MINTNETTMGLLTAASTRYGMVYSDYAIPYNLSVSFSLVCLTFDTRGIGKGKRPKGFINIKGNEEKGLRYNN